MDPLDFGYRIIQQIESTMASASPATDSIGLPKKNGFQGCLLGGSWYLLTKLLSNAAIITPIKVLMTRLTKSHEPPANMWLSPRMPSKRFRVSDKPESDHKAPISRKYG